MPRFGGLRSTPAPQQTPRRNKKGTRGNPRESRGRPRQAEEHPASPHDLADPASQQGPTRHSDPPSATKRPPGRDALRPGSRAGHFARPATRLMDAEMMTTPSGYDSQAWRNAMRRICLDSMLVSEIWNVMPTVKDR